MRDLDVQTDGPYAPTVVPFMHILTRISSSQACRKQRILCPNHTACSLSCKTMAYMAFPPIRRVLAAIFDTIFIYFALLLRHL